jgi:hypothetical protein
MGNEQANYVLQDKQRAIESLKSLITSAEQQPMRWAVKLLYSRYASSLLTGGVTVLMIAVMLSWLVSD